MKKFFLMALPFAALVVEGGLAKYVDPFTGTSGTGHTHPAASFPFGMIQAGPDTGIGDWAYCSGYQYRDDSVYGYSQNHLSGTGCADYGDVQVLPFAGQWGAEGKKTRVIDKKSETAKPGYYSIRQPDDGLTVEIAAAKRAAIYRFVYDKDREPNVLINLPFGVSDSKASIGNKTKNASVYLKDDSRIEGTFMRKRAWLNGRIVAFAIEFDRPWTSIVKLPDLDPEAAPTYLLGFAPVENKALKMKVAVCTTDSEGARRNLLCDIPDWDFDRVRHNAYDAWNDFLSRSVAEGSAEQLTNWYTALYHLYLQPNDWADADGRFRGPDGKIRKAENGRFYTTLSMWDTFRAAQPWYTILAPDVARDVVSSLLEHAKGMGGRLPVMSYGGRNVDCMIGNHSVPILVDACLKGLMPDDGESGRVTQEAVYAAIRETLVNEHPGKIKEDWSIYDRYRYYPCDIVKSESVSRTLECCYDDWCAHLLAKKLGRTQDAAFFLKRAGYWRNVLDPEIGMMRGRDSKGAWLTPFNPYALGGGEERENCFTEGNSFQYSWHVLHDAQGLIDAMGGRAAFTDRLDSLFRQPENAEGMGERVDVTGLIGQYAHGNEPSHHVIYFYPQVGHPEKAAERIREVFDTQYHVGPDGLCGNDDCGQMSAWYLFSAMGFYPFDPCGGEYVIGAPQLPKMTLRMMNGRVFTVTAKNHSRENRYVMRVTLNGRPLEGWKIRHSDIINGGSLEFVMGPRASVYPRPRTP